MIQEQKNSLKMLEENIIVLNKTVALVRYSADKCNNLESPYSLDELESIEAFTSRFERSSDIFTQKAVKSLHGIMVQDSVTFIDIANFLEKLRIAESADDVIALRNLRNKIAHDYMAQDMEKLFRECLKLTPTLEMLAKNLKDFVEDFKSKNN